MKDIIVGRPQGMWRWKEFLPPVSKIISLGEGDTPLIRSERIGDLLGIDELYFKAEFLLPTGSLKDRSVSVAVSHAKSIGAQAIVVSSTGNHAASVAAYAAAAGLKSYVFVPEKTDPSKVKQASICGSQIIKVKGGMEQIGHLIQESIREFGWYPCLSTNPFRNEGKKTCAYEIWQQLGFQVPDLMIHPIAGGMGLWAAWKGWKELNQLGWAHSTPRMVGAQASQVAPIAQAWASQQLDPSAVPVQQTVAESIAIGTITPGLGYRTLNAIRDSKGDCIALSDASLLEARTLLAEWAGIYVEPASAASLAALFEIQRTNKVPCTSKVVCVLTGHGFKQYVENDQNGSVFTIEPSLAHLKLLIK